MKTKKAYTLCKITQTSYLFVCSQKLDRSTGEFGRTQIQTQELVCLFGQTHAELLPMGEVRHHKLFFHPLVCLTCIYSYSQTFQAGRKIPVSVPANKRNGVNTQTMIF